MKKLVFAFLAALFSSVAAAQAYPSKPVRLVVAFPPGGPTDIIARLVSAHLDSLGQPLVVENVGGAGGNIATARTAKAEPDGYTLLVHSSGFAVNPALSSSAGYDPQKDFRAIAIVASQPNFIIVHADFPAKTLAELLDLAKREKLAYASPSSGTTPHLTAENLFRVRAKVDITHVPFKGAGPMMAAMLSGQPPIGSAAGAGPMPHIKSGKLRALAVSSARRVPALPDVPTLTELGFPGMEDYTWIGIFAPAGTPDDIAQRLNSAVLQAVRKPEFRERLDSAGFEATAAPLADTAAYLRAELAKWAKVVKDTGAKVD
jgi:tripartite-type tricarboxylate transporter receptor subunit TctC